MIVIVGSNKGGSGKTATAVNVSTALAGRGFDVCLVDADDQRSAAKWHAEREAAGLTPALTLLEKRDNISAALKTLGTKFDHVIVDVAGRNSRELITGATVADVILAPHQCSQVDLDTIGELAEQVSRIRDLNPELRTLAYQTMSSTNLFAKAKERADFEAYLAEFPDIGVLQSVGYHRKVYRDVMTTGESVVELNTPAAEEINKLVDEVFGHA